MKFHIRYFLKNLSGKIQFSLKSDKNYVYILWRPIYIFHHISLSSSENDKYFRKSCRENQDIYLTLHTFSPKIVLIWKTIVKPDRPHLTAHACSIPKATDTLSEYVISIAFPQQHCLQKRSAMSRYTYIASCVDLEKEDKTEIRNVCSWNVIICWDSGQTSVGVP